MVDSSDERDFRRMTLDCAMTFRRGGSHEEHAARARNISSTGVLFVTGEALTPGEQLTINVTPKQAVVAPLNARVEVIRVEADGADYAVACRIHEFLT